MQSMVYPYIPWQKTEDWHEAGQFFRRIDRHAKLDLEPVYGIAESIRHVFEELSDFMDTLCGLTCISCQDVCCEKATIWYDFRDLLYFYFAFGSLPDAQITKRKNKRGGGQCVHFSRTGCLLPRQKRPFVCTWYLCPAQKQAMGAICEQHTAQEIIERINSIKMFRDKMEFEFCRISGGIESY